MLLTLPEDVLDKVLRCLPFEDQLSIISTQKKLYRQPGVDELQAHVGVLRFHQKLQRHDFSQLKGTPRKLAVIERKDAQQELIARFDARYHIGGSKLLKIRKWLLVSLDATLRLLKYLDRPNMYVSMDDDGDVPGMSVCWRSVSS